MNLLQKYTLIGKTFSESTLKLTKLFGLNIKFVAEIPLTVNICRTRIDSKKMN